MSRAHGRPPRVEASSAHQSPNMQLVAHEVERQMLAPPSGDSQIADMWTAFLPAIRRYEPVASVVAAFVNNQTIIHKIGDLRGVPVSEVVGRLRTSIQYELLERAQASGTRVHFPEGVRGWRSYFAHLASNETRMFNLEFALNYLPTNTTHGSRYGGLEVVRQLEGDPCNEGIDWWEGGSSVGLGAAQTQLKAHYPFLPIRLVRPTGRVFADGSLETEEDVVATVGCSRALGAAAIPGFILCSDIWDARDSHILLMAKACLRPQELNNSEGMDRHNALAGANLPNRVFAQADITSSDLRSIVRNAAGDRLLRHGFLGTVLDQIGQQNVQVALRNGLATLEEDGIFLFADFGHPDPKDPRRFLLSPRWGDWTYGLYAIHAADPDAVIQPLMIFKTSRCREAQIGTGVLDIGGVARPFRDHLVAAAGPPEATGADSLNGSTPS